MYYSLINVDTPNGLYELLHRLVTGARSMKSVENTMHRYGMSRGGWTWQLRRDADRLNDEFVKYDVPVAVVDVFTDQRGHHVFLTLGR